MEAGEQSFKFVTHTSNFVIPFFQRGYVWDDRNWAPMLEDFLQNKSSQFFGSIILKHLRKHTNDVGSKALVIDGQQRLTTMSILLKSVNDSLHLPGGGLHDQAYPYLFYKPNALRDESYTRITHSKIDKQAFEFVLRSSAEQICASNSPSRIVACYKYFFKELEKCSQEDKEWLFNRFVNSEEPFLVVIDLEEKDDEQSIFDTINSAGVRLSYADTIKNLLFQVALQKAGAGKEEQIYKLYETTWFDDFEGDADSRDYWQREAQSVRVKRTMLEVFLHSFAIIQGFYDPRKDNLSQLPTLYRDKVKEMESIEDVSAFLKALSEAAGIYREKLGSFGAIKTFSYADGVGRLFHILDQCNVLTFHPYLLHLFCKYQNDEAMLKARFVELERFVMRQYAAHATTRQNNAYCVEFINDESSVKRAADAIPTGEIEAHLKAIGNRQAKLILFWIELYRRHVDKLEVEKDRHYAYQLEHVLPQKWEAHWLSVPVFDDSGSQVIDPEKARNARNHKCYEIGNMTLLSSSLNVAISNSQFDVKINGEGRKKGIRQYAELHITKDDILKPYDDGDKTWDEVRITNRTTKLIHEFMNLWG